MNNVIQQIIQKAKKDKGVVAVALFGSYARGEAYQDIDICIFLVQKRYGTLVLSKKKLEYTPNEGKYDVQIFQQLPLYIRKRILKEGKIIYHRDEDALYDLYYLTIQEYSHYQPIYEDYLKRVAYG